MQTDKAAGPVIWGREPGSLLTLRKPFLEFEVFSLGASSSPLTQPGVRVQTVHQLPLAPPLLNASVCYSKYRAQCFSSGEGSLPL